VSMKYIRDHYGVPAKRGMRMTYWFQKYDRKTQKTQWIPLFTGTITSSLGRYLGMRVANRKTPLHFHPTWNITYEDGAGNIVWDTRPAPPDCRG